MIYLLYDVKAYIFHIHKYREVIVIDATWS